MHGCHGCNYITFNHYKNYAFRMPDTQEGYWVGQLFVVSLPVYSNNYMNVCLMTATPPIIGVEICSNDKIIWSLSTKSLPAQHTYRTHRHSITLCSFLSFCPQFGKPSIYIYLIINFNQILTKF